MNAQTAHDRYLQAPYADDDAPDLQSSLDEMGAEPDCHENWLGCPHSVSGLLALIRDRGVPRNDGTRSDDALRDMYETRIKSVREDFDTWAQQPARGKAAPVDVWRDAG